MKKKELTIVSVKEAVSHLDSHSRIFIQGAAMTPNVLVDAMCDRSDELRNVEVIHLHTEGKAAYAAYPCNEAFTINSCFVGKNVRSAINSEHGAYIPIFLSEIHLLFRRNILPIDVAFIHVSPPDKHGYCSLGVSVDITLPAIEMAKVVIAQVNPQVPRTRGDGIIHINNIDYAIEVDVPIHATLLTEPTESEKAIGYHVASLIEDGATLQMGIGNIPNAALGNLHNHKRLGVHTEMFSDGIIPLIEEGVITGEEKVKKRGKVVTSFAMGSQKLYDFVDQHPIIHFREAAYTNDTAIIRRNPKVTAINSAIEIDLTGQVCADTIGKYQYSGVGGQMDFIRGASLSQGGKAIIAMPSITSKGVSKIVPYLKEGAGVTTTRAHVHYVVTENGIVNLFGKNLKQRTKALIEIAHPSVQEYLEKEAHKHFKSLA